MKNLLKMKTMTRIELLMDVVMPFPVRLIGILPNGAFWTFRRNFIARK